MLERLFVRMGFPLAPTRSALTLPRLILPYDVPDPTVRILLCKIHTELCVRK